TTSNSISVKAAARGPAAPGGRFEVNPAPEMKPAKPWGGRFGGICTLPTLPQPGWRGNWTFVLNQAECSFYGMAAPGSQRQARAWSWPRNLTTAWVRDWT